MTEFAKYYDTVQEVTHTLYQRGYPQDKVILYMHPLTKREMYTAASEEGQMLDVENSNIAGYSVLESQTMPENMVTAVVVEHLQRGSDDAVAFDEIEDGE